MDKGDRSAATSLVRNTLSALCVRSRAEPFPHLHQLQLAVQRASRTGCSTRILYREVEGVGFKRLALLLAGRGAGRNNGDN